MTKNLFIARFSPIEIIFKNLELFASDTFFCCFLDQIALVMKTMYIYRADIYKLGQL